jgi:formate hydrogenlyase subunit 3/multisubunit Na+/H+ antiporter MnhD subunit
MALFLILALVIFPISLGGILIIFSRRLSSPTPLYLFILNILVMIASALAASFSVSSLRLCFIWQPSAGEMCLLFEKTSLLLVLLVSISLLLIIIIHHRQTPVISSQQLGLVLISISAANTAFLTEHFLLRYAALEAAGLCVVGASLALSRSSNRAWDNTKLIFLNFRFGDIGLLTAIFLIYASSDTFNISQNFNLAVQLPLTIRVVLTIGLLSAVWIKMAIWPLGFWADLCSSLPPIMRTWLVDLLMPSLGAYLLYRTSPLLLSSSSISEWVVFIGCIAALTKVFFTSTNNHGMMLNRNPLEFSSVCLVLLSALVDQKIIWAFMVFWMLTRLAFLLISLRQELAPVPQKTHIQSLYLASQLLLLGFSLIALWQATLPTSISPVLIAILWTIWWMQLIRILKFSFSKKNISQKRSEKERIKEIIRSTFIGLSLAAICTAVLTGTIFLLSLLVKGKGIWIIPNRTYFQYFPLLSLNFWYSLVLAAFVLFFLADKTADFKEYAKTLVNSIRLWKQPSLVKETGSNPDLLDFTAYISSFFIAIGTYIYKTIEHGSTSYISKFLMASATYIYENIEHGSIEKLIKGIQKVFAFLFNKVEKFTSADLWLHALRSVIDSSHRVQRMHPGLLRVNLVWLLLFIVVLVLIAVSPNIGSIFSIE